MAPYYHMPLGSPSAPPVGEFTFAGSGTGLYGQPVYASGPGLVSLAKANAMATSAVVGVIGSVAVAPAGYTALLTAGQIVNQSAALWDAIAGTTGGLAANTTYYLSAATAGHYTATAPTTSGQTVEPVLWALSPTQALLLAIPPIQL